MNGETSTSDEGWESAARTVPGPIRPIQLGILRKILQGLEAEEINCEVRLADLKSKIAALKAILK